MAPATPPPGLRSDVPLASRTSLGLGGPARWLLEAERAEDVVAALRWAAAEGVAVTILGGGSNVVVADTGVDGLVLCLGLRGLERRPVDGAVLLTAAAGEPWDRLVEAAVEEGLAGLECLSGIPGTVGAAPIQNVGAYGQEVAEVAPRGPGARPGEPGGADAHAERVPFRLPGQPVPSPSGPLRGARRDLPPRAGGRAGASLPGAGAGGGRRRPGARPRAVRETVLALRRSKSMVIEAGHEDRRNQRSVGSFFVNPVLPAAEAERVAERAAARGAVARPPRCRAFPPDRRASSSSPPAG